MAAVLLDTHAWVWSFAAQEMLSASALTAIQEADAVYVSPISFFEIGQKVRIGKWPEMADTVSDLPQILADQGGFAALFTAEICLRASLWDWHHRDPFDRLIAATAMESDQTLITKDQAFSDVKDLRTVW